MNCQQLHQDIQEYKDQLSQLEVLLNQIKETSKKTSGFDQLLDNTESLADQLLEKYLKEFAKHYPEILEKPELSENIEGFNEDINSTLLLPDGRVLVGGRGGELRILSFDTDSQAKFGEEIDGFDIWVASTLLLPDARVLVGGGWGDLRILSFHLESLKSNLDKIIAD